MKVKSIGLALAFAGLGVLQQISVAQALTWNWSYSTSTDTASGQWVSDGSTYDPTGNTTYTIKSITGQRSGSAISQPGLSTFNGADNTFKWNGTNIITDNNGISYTTAAGSFNAFCGSCGTMSYNKVNFEDPASAAITSSSLSAAVPEPSETLGLLVLGAIGIGGWLKKRKVLPTSVPSRRV